MSTKPVSANADPKEVGRAQKMWSNFTVFTKYGVIVTVVILALMACFLL